MNPYTKNRLVLLLLIILSVSACLEKKSAGNSVCFDKSCFDVELASTPDEQVTGLMNRRSLDKNKGMLFVFPNSAKHTFWMKDTLIPLDMIWLDYALRVVHMEENVPPCQKDPCPRYIPFEEALYVLELNAGKADQAGIEVGSQLSFNIKLEE